MEFRLHLHQFLCGLHVLATAAETHMNNNIARNIIIIVIKYK